MIRLFNSAGEKIYWSSEISDMLALMFLWHPRDRLQQFTEIAARIMSCSRCCIILQKENQKKERKLVIVAGYPEKEHGIGIEIKAEYGADFLEEVIRAGNIVLISDPLRDKRVSYMRELIRTHQIKKQLFVPLFYKRIDGGFVKDPFGVMTFDSTEKDQEKFEKAASTVNKIAKVVVSIILNEQRRSILDQQLARKVCTKVFTESQKGFEDEFRNIQTSLEGNILRIQKILSRSDICEKEVVKKAQTIIASLAEISQKFSKKTEEFLCALKFNSSTPNLSEQDLKCFIRTTVEKIAQNLNAAIEVDLRKLPDGMSIKLDREKMEVCLRKIIENAVKFKADKIWVRSAIRNTDKNKKMVLVTIANNGLEINSIVADQLFMYFSSIDRMSESSGLSIAKSIVEAHNGQLKLQTKPYTQFIIQLPLEN